MLANPPLTVLIASKPFWMGWRPWLINRPNGGINQKYIVKLNELYDRACANEQCRNAIKASA